jgi:hypothetical protein
VVSTAVPFAKDPYIGKRVTDFRRIQNFGIVILLKCKITTWRTHEKITSSVLEPMTTYAGTR